MNTLDDVPPPPYSETDIFSQNGSAPHDDGTASSTTSGVIYTPPETPRLNASPLEFPSSPAAATYFESRPCPFHVAPPVFTHSLTVSAQSRPDDFPFQHSWRERDVGARDWNTFLNFLLPEHDASSNSDVVERKLRAEVSDDGNDSVSTAHAEAQLRQQRSTRSPRSLNLEDLEATVADWNQGFFNPRGIRIRALQPADELRIPGAWSSSFDQSSRTRQAPDGQAPARSPRNLTLGSLRLNQNGIYYGDHVIADRSGLNLSNIPRPLQALTQNGLSDLPNERQTGCGRGRGRRRGWDRGERHKHPRSSSVSSNSSSTSDSSVDSIPDVDDLEDNQLPAYKKHIDEWLAQPQTVRSREDLRRFQHALRMERAASLPADRKALRLQLKQARKEWRVLRKKQRQLRRQEKKEARGRRRAERRERRSRRSERSDDGRGAPSRGALDRGFGPPPPPCPMGLFGTPGGRGPSMPGAFPGGPCSPHPAVPSPGDLWTSIPAFGPFAAGRSWGRGSGRGRCGRRYADGRGRNAPRPYPGAWPGDEDDGPVYASSQAIYDRADALQVSLDQKREATRGSRQRFSSDEPNHDREMVDLQDTIKALRLKGDEEYAIELSRLDN